jgi:perosamine synthetase
MDFIPQMAPLIEQEERDAVSTYMESGAWLTEHVQTKAFAKMIAEYTKSNHAFIMANGTVSLTTALYACGVRAGDEVLVPDFTMVASANAAVLLGASVKFVDIDRKSLCMDFHRMREAITPNTKAVVLVTINGRYPKDIDLFVPYCTDLGIWVIEDAAQSLGSWYSGHSLGTFGHIGSFSFSMPKIITTGQGGALITNNNFLAENVGKLRDFGREKPGADHYLTQGWNFKFTDLQAVIGIEQMKKLPQRVERKKEMGRLYQSLLRDIPQIEMPFTDFNNTAPWFYDILVEDREALQIYLQRNGIGSREFYPPLHSEPVFGRGNEEYPVAVEVARKGLWLPSSLSLTDAMIHYICFMIRLFYERG